METRVQEKIGVAGIFGMGNIEGIGVLEIGAQSNYYLVGDFQHGLQVGVEALYTHFTLSNSSTTSKPDGKLLSIGPYLGYKYAADFGLTGVVQFGTAKIFGAETLAENNSPIRATDSHAFLNLNIGWSF